MLLWSMLQEGAGGQTASAVVAAPPGRSMRTNRTDRSSTAPIYRKSYIDPCPEAVGRRAGVRPAGEWGGGETGGRVQTLSRT